MKSSLRSGIQGYFTCALIFLLSTSIPATGYGQSKILDAIEIATKQNASEIAIHFNAPMQYIAHEPVSHGSTLLVQLRPVRGLISSDLELDVEERLNWIPSKELPLKEVRYDGNVTGNVQLRISFKRDVEFKVRSSKDYRSLIITVPVVVAAKSPEKLKQPVQQAPVAQPQVTQPTMPRPEPVTGTIPKTETRSIAVIDFKKPYAINLLSSNVPIDLKAYSNLLSQPDYHPYTTHVRIGGKSWYRLRLGFFSSAKEAKKALLTFKSKYKHAWVTRVSHQEMTIGLKKPVTSTTTKATSKTLAIAIKPKPAIKQARKTKGLKPPSDNNLNELMESARKMMARKDYSGAIRIYTRVLQFTETTHSRDAQEFLGLARERKGQFAHAKAEYTTYLSMYPESDGAERVKQRLVALTTARKKPRERLRTAKRAKEKSAWNTFGSFSQFYRRDANITDTEGETVTQSSISTDLDVSSRLRTEKYDIRTRFSGGNLNDFLDNGERDQGRVTSMYMNMSNPNKDISARVGRQSRSSGGVLGRFDGGHFGYQLTSQTKLNLVAGFPVDSSSDSPQSDRYFYGASIDLGTYAGAWDFVLFAIEQIVDDIDDRQAVGGEVRYFHPERSLLSLIDYDTSYDELNTFLLIGNWRLANQVTINSTIDYRNSPLITTRNALQGQTATSINNLLLTNTEEEVRQLAIDRTAESRTFTFGLSKPVNSKLQVNGDVTVTSITGTVASGGVEATPETGNDYLYGLQLIGSSLIKEGDITILGLRYSDTSSSKTTSLSLNSRYPVIREWRINPRLRLDYRDNIRNNTNQWTFAPSIRSEYRWKRKYRFELEAGGERSNLQLTDTTDKTSSYFFSLGYRADF